LNGARFLAPGSRQLTPPFAVTPCNLGQAARFFGLLMNSFGRLPHLLGEISRFVQHLEMLWFQIVWWNCHARLRHLC